MNVLECTKWAAEMEAAGDAAGSLHMRELAAKAATGEVRVAFCGHFSAGKSSLVNVLCGAELLPASPIPTSANVVTIRYGELERARIVNREGREQWVALEALAAACRDGDG